MSGPRDSTPGPELVEAVVSGVAVSQKPLRPPMRFGEVVPAVDDPQVRADGRVVEEVDVGFAEEDVEVVVAVDAVIHSNVP